MRVAVYGKGGIGKSTITSNISHSLSEAGSKVIQIGCDPKCDSTKPLLKGRYQRTVTQYIRDVPPSKRRIEEIVSEGSNGILCIEAGAHAPVPACRSIFRRYRAVILSMTLSIGTLSTPA